MTICIAAIHHQYYSTKPHVGSGIILVTDRMFTQQDVGYEPHSMAKFGKLRSNAYLMIAGDIEVHTMLIPKIVAFVERTPNAMILDIATAYSDYLCQLKSQRAVRRALGSTYGFSAAQFAKLQKSMDPNVVHDIHNDLTDDRVEFQAIIAGCDADRDADNQCHLYRIDRMGIVTCHDGTGFVCIGAGLREANAQFIGRGYSRRADYYPALLTAYMAKKAAERVGGIGETTDINLVRRSEGAPIDSTTFAFLEQVYATLDQKMGEAERSAVQELMKMDVEYHKAMKRDPFEDSDASPPVAVATAPAHHPTENP